MCKVADHCRIASRGCNEVGDGDYDYEKGCYMPDHDKASLCGECGVGGDFCGYHGLGRKNISLCVACAEQEVDVWSITLAGENDGGVVAKSLHEAIEIITSIVGEMDHEDGYTVWYRKMSRLKVVTMPEFKGF